MAPRLWATLFISIKINEKSSYFLIDIENYYRDLKNLDKSWSRSRLLGLDIDVETRSRYLDGRDQLLESVEMYSTVKTYSLTVSRARVSMETTSRQIKIPRLSLYTLVSRIGDPRAYLIFDQTILPSRPTQLTRPLFCLGFVRLGYLRLG